MQFLLIITHDDAFVPTEQLVENILAWDTDMDRRGVRVDGRPLRPAEDAVTVRVRDGARRVTAGPAGRGAGPHGRLRAPRVRQPRRGGRSRGGPPHGRGRDHRGAARLGRDGRGAGSRAGDSSGRWTRGSRLVLALLGVAGLFVWAGWIAGPVIAVPAALLPSRAGGHPEPALR
jgi:hypothetical protein